MSLSIVIILYLDCREKYYTGIHGVCQGVLYSTCLVWGSSQTIGIMSTHTVLQYA